jgi:hypothetical protein
MVATAKRLVDMEQARRTHAADKGPPRFRQGCEPKISADTVNAASRPAPDGACQSSEAAYRSPGWRSTRRLVCPRTQR